MSRALIFLFVIVASPMAFTQSPIPGEEGAARAIRNGIAIPEPAPDRSRGEGPFNTLLITDVTLISGEGAPPRGPVTIVVEGDRIAAIQSTVPSISGARIIDGSGMYALPGFIDAHTLLGNTGQGLTGGGSSHGGHGNGPFAGICLEPQSWPDAPNNASFPSIDLAPGERYQQVSEFAFSQR